MNPPLLPILYCYDGSRWCNYPGRQFALMREMAKETPVYFLNAPVIQGRVAEFALPAAERIEDNLTVIDKAFTFRYCRSGKHLGPPAAVIDSLFLHRLLRRLGVSKYIFWCASPRKSILWGIDTTYLVYDSIDPAHEEGDHSRLHDAEMFYARKARVVFCTAQSLQERLAPFNPRCHLLSNAAGARDFPRDVPREVPAQLQGAKQPIAGCIGTVDFRIDLPLMTAVARKLPNVTFAMVGLVALPEGAIDELAALPNVIMIDSTDDETGRALIASFDVGLIPFHTGLMGDGINSVKMYMYLAAGKPVVTTWMRESLRHPSLIAAARDASDFAQAIERELSADTPEKKASRIAFARENTWRKRAETAARYLREAGLVEGAA